MKKIIKLTESDLTRIVRRVIKENREEKIDLQSKLDDIFFGKDPMNITSKEGEFGYLSGEHRLSKIVSPKQRIRRIENVISQLEDYIKRLESAAYGEKAFVDNPEYESEWGAIDSGEMNESKKKYKKSLNESVLLTLGGIALGAGIIKKAHDYLSNRALERDMEETGEVIEGSNGVVMKEYIENSTGDVYYGVEVIDKTRDEGFRRRNVLLFKGDNPKRIERILNSELKHDTSDEARMDDNYEDKFGQFIADKRIYKGRE